MPRQLLLMGVLLAAPLSVSAQAGLPAAGVSPGARLRVTTDSGHPKQVVGVLVAYSADSLWLQGGGKSYVDAVPRSRVIQLEVSRSRPSRWRLGAFVGTLVGIGVGALLVSGNPYEFGDDSPALQVLGSMAAGGLVGGLVGGAAGSAVHRDRWQVSPWPAPEAGAR
ncbi:MAG: hypothetical protein ACREOC_19325 [Gemmatimonadales bacterium]